MWLAPVPTAAFKSYTLHSIIQFVSQKQHGCQGNRRVTADISRYIQMNVNTSIHITCLTLASVKESSQSKGRHFYGSPWILPQFIMICCLLHAHFSFELVNSHSPAQQPPRGLEATRLLDSNVLHSHILKLHFLKLHYLKIHILKIHFLEIHFLEIHFLN